MSTWIDRKYLFSTDKNAYFSGCMKIQRWLKDSLITRLQKSLSCDWIHESRAHKFPLRTYYVQLEWQKKTRQALAIKRETLTSIHELISQISANNSIRTVRSSQHRRISSVLIEGIFLLVYCHLQC